MQLILVKQIRILASKEKSIVRYVIFFQHFIILLNVIFTSITITYIIFFQMMMMLTN